MPVNDGNEEYSMDVFLTAGLETYEDFLAVYQEGDEKRKDEHQERDLILHALSNSKTRDRYKIVEFLLKKGAQTNVLDEDHRNGLHYILARACQIDPVDLPETIELCKVFIDGGASVNQVDSSNGQTPLHILIRVNFMKFSDEELEPLNQLFLSQKNILMKQKNRAGYSPLDLAKKLPGRNALKERLKQYE